MFRFSVDLYQFRSAAALLGKADADAIVGMPDWVQLGGMHPGFASRLIGRGGYVNLAVNVLLAGLLANMVRRIGLRWERLGETFDTFSGSRNEMASKNPDDPAPPAALTTHGSDALLPALPASLVQPLTPQVVPAALQEAAPAARGSFTLQMPPQKGADSVPSGGEAGHTNREEMFPVWGGSGEVTLAEAKAKPEVYIVDPVNGTIWSRPFYLQLHPEPV